jgi:hypothetical protein
MDRFVPVGERIKIYRTRKGLSRALLGAFEPTEIEALGSVIEAKSR